MALECPKQITGGAGPRRRIGVRHHLGATPYDSALARVELVAYGPGPHVGPDLLDVAQALLFRAPGTSRPPTGRYVHVLEPDRVLLFVVDDNLENRVLAVDAHFRRLLIG